MTRRALYAGSFDPLTNGHLDIIKRAAKTFDELVVAVVANPQKKCLFSISERVEIIKNVLQDVSNVKVDFFEGLLADYVNLHSFDAVVRGLRASMDFENEIAMAQMNDCLFKNGTESVFFMTRPQYSFISSSMIKEVFSLGGDIDGTVPALVKEKMNEKFNNK